MHRHPSSARPSGLVPGAPDPEGEIPAVATPRPETEGADRPQSGTPAWRTGIRRVIRSAAQPGTWRRGPILTALALLLGLLLLLHAQITDRAGLGSLVETFLPWFGLFVPLLLAPALWRRSPSAVLALLLPAVVWLNLFGGLLSDKSHSGGDLTVVSHNVDADNPDPTGTARRLAASGADVLALEEVTAQAKPLYEKELATAYPYHTVQGTVGLWSTLPLSDTRPVDIKMDAGPLGNTKPLDVKMTYNRALRATVATRQGPLAVYVAHLGSVRVLPSTGFWTESRNRGATALAQALAAEQNERVVLLGDLNGTTDDRAFHPITSRLRSAQDVAGDGFGFSWPARFPVARIDQILVRGVKPVSSWVLAATGSDHRPVAAAISW
ncbi:endonuclease/exonuclease/phosphatase family protein [Streptomyces sp. TLI_146]|uniref:endonuclease/exonuclease/phosphatase family protein n=1 Tax=Streptomyces sp. TLI_146 TaxID=1938858 RepID=UPI000C711DA9|nr:endonuclease/exonuclease/phosphatase family protein [Streptomyces sp. TLI_146]PKV90025.1 vancomycin resistance protein VanJ [Streptomyces sp. TLI_146]